jgi:hypothetical protein
MAKSTWCNRDRRSRVMMRSVHWPPLVLQNFGSRSGTSHLLQAPVADAIRTAITTVHILRMEKRLRPDAHDSFVLIRRSAI